MSCPFLQVVVIEFFINLKNVSIFLFDEVFYYMNLIFFLQIAITKCLYLQVVVIYFSRNVTNVGIYLYEEAFNYKISWLFLQFVILVRTLFTSISDIDFQKLYKCYLQRYCFIMMGLFFTRCRCLELGSSSILYQVLFYHI